MSKIVYLDNAATTKMSKEVLEAMLPYLKDEYGNPSAHYDLAIASKKAVDKAKEQIAKLINCNSNEIYFTSGGTESDNWALKCLAEKYKGKKNHIITTKIEHHAILNTAKWLENNGFEITYLDVDKNGLINLSDLEKAIQKDTFLISVMTANNEIGTIQPISEIGKLARKKKILFHTDAVQAFGHIPVDVSKMKIDLLSASGHKINGPKGVGILYIKNGINIDPFMHGGMQENGKRAGTYNVPAIVGMGQASLLAGKEMGNTQISKMRDYFLDRIMDVIPNTSLNGDKEKRLPNNINIYFEGIDSETLLVILNEKGIYASAGSACTTGIVDPSHVLLAIGFTREMARSCIRFSISGETTKDDLDYTVDILKNSIKKLH